MSCSVLEWSVGSVDAILRRVPILITSHKPPERQSSQAVSFDYTDQTFEQEYEDGYGGEDSDEEQERGNGGGHKRSQRAL